MMMCSSVGLWGEAAGEADEGTTTKIRQRQPRHYYKHVLALSLCCVFVCVWCVWSIARVAKMEKQAANQNDVACLLACCLLVICLLISTAFLTPYTHHPHHNAQQAGRFHQNAGGHAVWEQQPAE